MALLSWVMVMGFAGSGVLQGVPIPLIIISQGPAVRRSRAVAGMARMSTGASTVTSHSGAQSGGVTWSQATADGVARSIATEGDVLP